MDPKLIAGIVIVALVGLFVLTFILNKKTPKPEGCEDLDAKCDACQVTTCTHNNPNKTEEK